MTVPSMTSVPSSKTPFAPGSWALRYLPDGSACAGHQTGTTGARPPGTRRRSTTRTERRQTTFWPGFRLWRAIGRNGSRCCRSYHRGCSCCGQPHGRSSDYCSRSRPAAPPPASPHMRVQGRHKTSPYSVCALVRRFSQPPNSLPISTNAFAAYSYCRSVVRPRA